MPSAAAKERWSCDFMGTAVTVIANYTSTDLPRQGSNSFEETIGYVTIKPHMAVRLKDIADELKLSVVTVSKVLRHHPDIGAETRERVLQRMKELNYQPNLAARALVTGRTHAVGLIVPDLVHPFFGQVAKALSGVLRKKGYSLILSSSDDDAGLEQQEINHLLARRVDVL